MGVLTAFFPSFPYLSVLTHTLPVSTAGNVELLFFDPLKLTFQLPLLLVVLNLLLWLSARPNWNRVVGKWFYLGMSKILRDYVFLFLQEKIKRIQQIRMEKELRAQQILEVQNLIQQHLWLSRTFLDSYSPSVYSVLIFLKLITEQQHALEGVASS